MRRKRLRLRGKGAHRAAIHCKERLEEIDNVGHPVLHGGHERRAVVTENDSIEELEPYREAAIVPLGAYVGTDPEIDVQFVLLEAIQHKTTKRRTWQYFRNWGRLA